jgi:DNA-binding protein Fis
MSVESLPDARRRAIDEFERTYLDRVMALAGGRSTQAAEIAGVSRQMLGRLLTKHRRGGGDGVKF